MRSGGPSMSRRSQIIGAQAALVALLVLVVYLTLLRPDSTDPLREIEAPGGEQQVQAPDGREGDGNGSAERRGASPGSGGPGGEGGGGTSGGGAWPGGVYADGGGTAAGAGAPGDAGVGVSPPGDQYGDSVETLRSRVKAGSAQANRRTSPANR